MEPPGTQAIMPLRAPIRLVSQKKIGGNEQEKQH
jgi:hypothetical protein